MTQRAAKDIIRDAIDALGVSQKQFARTLGVDPATVSRWVKGTQVPRISLVALLASTTGVDEVELWRAIAAAQRDENTELRRERDRIRNDRDELLARFEEFANRVEKLEPLLKGLEQAGLIIAENNSPAR